LGTAGRRRVDAFLDAVLDTLVLADALRGAGFFVFSIRAFAILALVIVDFLGAALRGAGLRVAAFLAGVLRRARVVFTARLRLAAAGLRAVLPVVRAPPRVARVARILVLDAAFLARVRRGADFRAAVLRFDATRRGAVRGAAVRLRGAAPFRDPAVPRAGRALAGLALPAACLFLVLVAIFGSCVLNETRSLPRRADPDGIGGDDAGILPEPGRSPALGRASADAPAPWLVSQRESAGPGIPARPDG
jgi:hypothetical protein